MFKDYLKSFFQFFLPKHALTLLAGLLANNQTPAIKNFLIRHFIRTYAVDMKEAQEESPSYYGCFNDFFIRKLKPGCRPLANAKIISPVDGFISEIGHIQKDQIFQAKGRYYPINELLACEPQTCERFEHGKFATLYLSPKDYHRIHMPIKASLQRMIYIPGRLFSVQPATVRTIPRLFSRNERVVVFFETEMGLMTMILVGATIVGSISTSWEGQIHRSSKKQFFNYENEKQIELSQGEEMGYFKLGSTVILLFENKEMSWLDGLDAGKVIRLGEALGE